MTKFAIVFGILALVIASIMTDVQRLFKKIQRINRSITAVI